MKYTEENKQFVNDVVNYLLQIPNLQNEVNPLLTQELRKKFSKAGERFQEILASFNALPGVNAELDKGDDPDTIIELSIPTNPFFTSNSKKSEIVILHVELRKSKVAYYTSSQTNTCDESEVSELYGKWLKENFKSTTYNNFVWTEITISELYVAVQKLIEAYLNLLEI